MEEDKSLEKNNHHGHHHEGKRCGLFNCCSGSKSKMIHIFLALAVALVIFLIGLSAGSHLNRYRGNNNFSGSKFNKQNYRSDMMPGGRGLRGGRGIPINNLQNPNIPVSGDTNPTGNVTPNNTTTPNNVAPTPTQP